MNEALGGQIPLSMRDIVEKIVHVAEVEGLAGLRKWVDRTIEQLGPSEVEATYVDLKQERMGIALAFASSLPKKQRPEIVVSDLASERTKNPGLWVTGLAHVQSRPIIDRARAAFEAGDVLCGLQRHYCAGCGPTTVMFNSITAFEQHLRTSRPGDEFMLLSVRQLSTEGILLKPTVTEAKRYLKVNPRDDLFLLRTNPPPAMIETLWEGRIEEEELEGLFSPVDGLLLVPFQWEQEFFIDAKMPNDKGAIPLGGAY